MTLVAGGVGITPCMSIVRDLTDRGWHGRIDLLQFARRPAEVIFGDELRYLAARHPNLHVHTSVTGEAPADWAGLRGHLTAQLLRECVPDVADRPALVCGPDAMANAVRGVLAEAGVPADRIKIESFTPSAAAAASVEADAGAAAATATFAASGKTAPLSPGRTVLEAPSRPAWRSTTSAGRASAARAGASCSRAR